MPDTTLMGLRVVTSPHASRPPGPGEWARRYVRHGMADILEWLGEPVGPAPDEPVPAMFVIRAADCIVAHPAIHAALRAQGFRAAADAMDAADPRTFVQIRGDSLVIDTDRIRDWADEIAR